MGLFKGIKKIFKPKTWLNLAKGVFSGDLEAIMAAGLTLPTAGLSAASYEGMDKKKPGVDMPPDDLASVSFLDTSVPALVTGSESPLAKKRQRTSKSTASAKGASFLGGVDGSASLI